MFYIHLNPYFIKFINKIYKFLLNIIILCIYEPVVAETKNIKIWANAKTENSFSKKLNYSNFSNNNAGFQFKKDYNNISSNLTLNYTNKNKLSFDQSFIDYSYRNLTFGVGKINRNWSFSPHTSLILSENARPMDSAYLTIRNQKKPTNFLFSWVGPWSFETFNASPSNSDGIKDSMLLGIRATIEPVNNLKLEIAKTSQWGGVGYKKNISALIAAIGGNTNDHEHANINQLAGFGFSYTIPKNGFPLRLYGQLMGEDEAGGLPSCYMYLLGLELQPVNASLISKFGVEIIDTRIDFSTNGNCGPNTAYNHAPYKYTNYNTPLGVPIGSEGKSINLWGTSNLSSNIDIDYSIENILINDTSLSKHRLSNSKENGWVGSLGISMNLNKFEIYGKVGYQNLSLNKNNITEGAILSINSIYRF